MAIKVFNDGPQYGVDSDEQRLQTLSALRKQREVLIRQEIAVLKHCRDRNIVQFVGACIRVSLQAADTMHLSFVMHMSGSVPFHVPLTCFPMCVGVCL